jgi:hypothetical protein
MRRSSRALRLRRQRSRRRRHRDSQSKTVWGKPPVPACAGACNETHVPTATFATSRYWPIASFRGNAGCRSLSGTKADMNRKANELYRSRMTNKDMGLHYSSRADCLSGCSITKSGGRPASAEFNPFSRSSLARRKQQLPLLGADALRERGCPKLGDQRGLRKASRQCTRQRLERPEQEILGHEFPAR